MKHTFSKATTVAVSLFFVASMALPAMAALFTDTSGNWAQQSIDNLSQKGILTGYPTGEFRPEGRITRAEFATMLVKAEHLENQFTDNGSNFKDVPRSFWGYRNIETVSDKGLVSGYPGGYFRPSQDISRAEAMAILVNAAGIAQPTDAQANQILTHYSDADQVPQWARRAVAAAIQSGIFVNYPSANLIEPNQPATRAEVAVMTDHLESAQANNNNQNNNQANNPYTSGNEYNNTTTTGSISQQGDLIRGHLAVVPAQTVFTGVVTQAFSSDRSHVGDPVTLTLDRPVLSASGDIVIPQGSQVSGSITSIANAGLVEKNAGVTLDFNRITTPDGRTFPISAEVNADNGILKAGTTKGRVARVAGRTLGGAAIGGAAGAVLGRVVGGKGRTDEGLLWGGIIGSGLGAASAVKSPGQVLVVQPGEVLQVRLRQPLTVNTP